MADVNITIDIDANTAAIDRVRAKLRSLCKEVDDCTSTMDKHTKSLRELSDAQDEAGRGSGRNQRGFNASSKGAKGLTKFLRTLAKFGFIYLAVEAAAALIVISSVNLLFKSGQWLAKAYQASLSGVAYAMVAIVAAASAAIAAMRQFQAVQFAPSFSEGAINTDDPMKAASGAMKMFIDDTQMAVVGTKGLSSAFKVLNDQAAVTGETTAVFRQLTNYTAGMGGDLEKGSQAMAKFLAQFQKDKTMTEAVRDAGNELGPNFKKILDEANKLGANTYEKFSEAAIKGELGETFALYANQLDNLNSTVIGRFKQGFTSVKNVLLEIGEPLLEPLTQTIPKIVNILESLFASIRYSVEDIGKGSLLTGLVSVLEKVSLFIGKLVNNNLQRGAYYIDWMRRGWEKTANVFERLQDYLRTLIPASKVLNGVFVTIFKAFGGSIGNSIENLSNQLVENEDKFQKFAQGFANFMKGFSEFGEQIRNLLINSLPGLGALLTNLGGVFKTIAMVLVPFNLFVEGLMKIAELLDAIFNPLFAVIEKVTFGFVSLRDVVQSLAGAVVALTVAMIASSKVRNFMGGVFDGGDILDPNLDPRNPKDRARRKGRMARKGAKGVKEKIGRVAGSKGVKAVGRGVANIGRMGVSGLSSIGGGSLAVGSALVAGSAAGGYFTGGFASDKLFNANTKMSRAGGAVAGAGAGAAAGAGIGASIGALFGGVGAGPGAIAGAIIGGIAGGINGYLKAGKERRKFDNIAKDTLKEYGDSLNDAVEKGDIKALEEAAKKANKQMIDMAGAGKYGAGAYNKRKKELEELNRQANNAFSNFSNFEAFFGDPDKLNQQIKDQNLGADAAKNSVLNIFEIMRNGGEDVGAVWSGVMGEFNQKLIQARLAMFDIPLATIEMQKRVDANQRKLLEGDTSEESITEFLKSAYEYALGETGGDALAANSLMQQTLEKSYGPGGSLETVADAVRNQADKLKLFDPQVLIDQLSATGKLGTQGKAIEALTEGKTTAGSAEMQIQKLLYASEDPAMTGKLIDNVLKMGVLGQISGDQVLGALSSPEALQAFALNAQDNMNYQDGARRVQQDKQTSASPNPSPFTMGDVNVNLTGFIKDEKVAKQIAVMVQEEISKYNNRSGSK